MRIIKPGMRREYKYKGICTHCDCHFECEKTECSHAQGVNEIELRILCPCCRRNVIVKQILIKVRYSNGD
jgi:hypothetical protein